MAEDVLAAQEEKIQQDQNLIDEVRKEKEVIETKLAETQEEKIKILNSKGWKLLEIVRKVKFW